MHSLVLIVPFLFGCQLIDGSPRGDFWMSYSVSSLDGSTALLGLSDTIDASLIDPENSIELGLDLSVQEHEGAFYTSAFNSPTVQRWDVVDGTVTPGPTISFANQGLAGGFSTMGAPDSAFAVDPSTNQIVQWNPLDMTITATFDIAPAIAREGWGWEERGGFFRDGVFYFYVTYTNDRIEFINDFVMGVLDTNDGTVSAIVDESCPATAGFGGWIDDNDDLYVYADSFGSFTLFFGDDVKQNCIRRIPKGSKELDDFVVFPESLQADTFFFGMEWGGERSALTTGVDLTLIDDFKTPFDFIFAPVHSSFVVDLDNETVAPLDLPIGGVGFATSVVDGTTYTSRLVGDDDGYVYGEGIEATLYRVDPENPGMTEQLFTFPGFSAELGRLPR